MKWSASIGDYLEIVDAINSAQLMAFHDFSATEPQLVANLVHYLPQYLNSCLTSTAYGVKVGGVFVHGSSFVQPDNLPKASPASIEIGDLLLLRTAVQGGRIIDRRALLLQAKKTDRYPASPDNANQHYLYAQWPEFKYIRSTPALNGKSRHVTGLDLYDAAKYLLIKSGGNHWGFGGSWFYSHAHSMDGVLTAYPSEPKLSHYRSFTAELVDFIFGDAGKLYKSPPKPKSKNWDQVIDDLVQVTAKRLSTFVRRATQSASKARGQGLIFHSGEFDKASSLGEITGIAKEESLVSDVPPKVPGRDVRGENDDEGGLSTIEFFIESEPSIENE